MVESTASATGTAVSSPLEIDDLRVSARTDRGRFPVLAGVSLRLTPGRILGLAGESGSGKTVTALAAMRLLDPNALSVDGGTIRSDGVDVLGLDAGELRRLRGAKVSMVFQEPMTSLDPMFTVGDSLVEVLRSHSSISRRAARQRSVELLARVGIPDPEQRISAYPFEFSGGMRQRVMIALAIACGPRALIADEPTTALDVTVQAQVMNLLRRLADDGMAVLLVTHDMGVMSEYSDDLAVMYAGQIVESGTTSDLLATPRHPYTAALLASVPTPDRRLERLPPIDGAVPPLHAMPAGCRFAPRCKYAVSECTTTNVELVALPGTGRLVRCIRSSEWELEGPR